MRTLKVSGEVWHNFTLNSLASVPSKESLVFGFSDIEFIELKKLVELDGSVVEYYDFGGFLVIPNGDNVQRARMIADKKIDVYLNDGDFGILDFVFYSGKSKGE